MATKTQQRASTARKTLAADPRVEPAKTTDKAPAAAAPVPPMVQEAAMKARIAANHEADEVIATRQTTTQKQLWARYREPVQVEVKSAFNFTKEDHTMVRYEPGKQEMPRGHAEDSYAQAHGVRIISK